jgi:hypothetical protein
VSPSRYLSPAQIPKHARYFLSYGLAPPHTFSPSESSLVSTVEENAPENDSEDSFAKFRFLPDHGEVYIRRKRSTVFIARWTPNSDSVDTTSEGNITPTLRQPCGPHPYLVPRHPTLRTFPLANHSSSRMAFVRDRLRVRRGRKATRHQGLL